jgi:ATP-binding cassette, subfamily B, bacterial MsbA
MLPRQFIALFAISLTRLHDLCLIAADAGGRAQVFRLTVCGAPAGTTHHVLPLLGSVQLMYGVPILMVLIIVWRSIGSFLGNYYLAKVSLGLIHNLRAPCSTACCNCPTAISTRTTPAT